MDTGPSDEEMGSYLNRSQDCCPKPWKNDHGSNSDIIMAPPMKGSASPGKQGRGEQNGATVFSCPRRSSCGNRYSTGRAHKRSRAMVTSTQNSEDVWEHHRYGTPGHTKNHCRDEATQAMGAGPAGTLGAQTVPDKASGTGPASQQVWRAENGPKED